MNNVLNEVCNGIKINNFQESIGLPIEQVEIILSELSNELSLLIPRSETVHYPDINPRLNIKEICLLDTNGYQVIFYLKPLRRCLEKIGIIIVLKIINDLGEVSLKTPATSICLNQLKDYVIYLQKCVEELNQDRFKSPYFVSCQNIFKSEAILCVSSSTIKNSFTLNFMININASESLETDITSTYAGAEAIVTIQNIEKFTKSIEDLLARLEAAS